MSRDSKSRSLACVHDQFWVPLAHVEYLNIATTHEQVIRFLEFLYIARGMIISGV